MTDDDEPSCCCQPVCDLLVNVGLLKPNTGMSTSLLNFDSRRDQLEPDHSTATPRQQAHDEASPVLPDYTLMPERPANSLERVLIARHARTLPSAAVVQERIERIVDQQPAGHIHERQEPAVDPVPDIMLR